MDRRPLALPRGTLRRGLAGPPDRRDVCDRPRRRGDADPGWAIKLLGPLRGIAVLQQEIDAARGPSGEGEG